MTSCRWNGRTNPRLTRNHLADCEGGTCPGCEPCVEGHCQVCGKEHTTVEGRGFDLTCAGCLGETRDHLNGILDKSARLLGEAIMQGLNSTAAMLAGPAADPEAWGYRRMSALAGRIDPSYLEDCRDEQHPLWVLGTWDMLVRELFGQQTDVRLTMTEAARYLDGHLTRLAHHRDFSFEELAKDLEGCDQYLENILSEGERDTRGAPCLKCRKPLLRIEKGGEYSWWCERCKQRSTADQYRYAVGVAYRANATRLPVTDLAERIGVPAGTIRRWAAKSEHLEGTETITTPPKLPYIGRDSQGRKVYDVATAEVLRDKRRVGEVA